MKSTFKLQGCTNLKLPQLGRMVTRHYDHFMSEVGLKNTQYALLSHIVKLGHIRPSDLAKCMQMEASTLTRNLQPMAAQGWLKVGSGEDARSRLVEATVMGHSIRSQGQRACSDALASVVWMGPGASGSGSGHVQKSLRHQIPRNDAASTRKILGRHSFGDCPKSSRFG